MCLSQVTKRSYVLKKDIKVKKLVYIGYNNNLYFGVILGKKTQVRKGLNTAKAKQIYTGVKYYSGFHCYLNKYDNSTILNSWSISIHRIVVIFTIPKGTKVLYGKQDGLTVIVTPVLIYNPIDRQGIKIKEK